MNKAIASNITQILSSIDAYVSIYEHDTWVLKATTEEIKSAFKLSIFVEKTIQHFITIETLDEFASTLLDWQKKHNQTTHNTNFFKISCDHMLKKFFKCPQISETNLDIAVRMYTSLLPRERLESFISKSILDAGFLEAISEYFQINSVEADQQELQFRLKLNYWAKYTPNNNEAISQEIREYLSTFELYPLLLLLLGILSLKDVTENEKSVQNLILDAILEKMLGRSVLNKPFWLILCKDIDVKYIVKVCTNHFKFLESFLNFLVYLGSMLEKVQYGDIVMWQSDPNTSLCPEISYAHLLNLFKSLCETNEDLREFVHNRIIQAETDTQLLLWTEIIETLFK